MGIPLSKTSLRWNTPLDIQSFWSIVRMSSISFVVMLVWISEIALRIDYYCFVRSWPCSELANTLYQKCYILFFCFNRFRFYSYSAAEKKAADVSRSPSLRMFLPWIISEAYHYKCKITLFSNTLNLDMKDRWLASISYCYFLVNSLTWSKIFFKAMATALSWMGNYLMAYLTSFAVDYIFLLKDWWFVIFI